MIIKATIATTGNELQWTLTEQSDDLDLLKILPSFSTPKIISINVNYNAISIKQEVTTIRSTNCIVKRQRE